jgi:hypothetical protein
MEKSACTGYLGHPFKNMHFETENDLSLLVLATLHIRSKKSVIHHSLNSFSLLPTHETGDDSVSNKTVSSKILERISHVASTRAIFGFSRVGKRCFVFLVPGGVSADMKKLGKGNTSWVEKTRGKIFGEAMQVTLKRGIIHHGVEEHPFQK